MVVKMTNTNSKIKYALHKIKEAEDRQKKFIAKYIETGSKLHYEMAKDEMDRILRYAVAINEAKELNMKNYNYRDTMSLLDTYEASNCDPNCMDLIFQDDNGNKLIAKNVPAPKNWDGVSDWSRDSEYVSQILVTNNLVVP